MRTNMRGFESFLWTPNYWAQPHINNYLSADWQFTAVDGQAYHVQACSVGGFVCAILQPTSTTTAMVLSWSGNSGWLAVADFDPLHANCSNNSFAENGGPKSASLEGAKFELRITGKLTYAGPTCADPGCMACSVAPPGGSGPVAPQTDDAAFQRFYQP
jgi:hypothetical protein